jgi:subtilase family serine protease
MFRLRLLAVLAAASAAALAGSTAPSARAAAGILPPPSLFATPVSTVTPPDLSTCRQKGRISCYRPQHLQQAYDLPSLYGQGLSGAGRTIVIVDAYGSPTVHKDLQAFDRAFGLPDPPSLRVIELGHITRFNADNPARRSWALETSLDVQWAHAMAPGARLVVLEVAPRRARTLPKQLAPLIEAVHYSLDHHLGDVISLSFGVAEPAFADRKDLWPLHHVFTLAKQRRVTVVAASGDTGATAPRIDGSCCYRSRVAIWPASDPYVTAVGGTKLSLDDAGNRTKPDTGWKDPVGASGGGVSTLFGRPTFQKPIDHTRPRGRSLPDVSMSASTIGGVLVYTSFHEPGGLPGGRFSVIGGTSESAPLFAGIVAIADQAAGHRLGFLNRTLYDSSVLGSGGIVDVVGLNNSFTFGFVGEKKHVVKGFRAQGGYDLVTGLGTVDAARLVPALVAAPSTRR